MILKTTIGAFTLKAETQAAVEGLRDERIFFRTTITSHDGGMAEAVNYLSQNETPPVLIIETASVGENMFAELNRLAEVCAPHTQLVLIGDQNDISLFKELLRQGVSQYFAGGVSTRQLAEAIQDLFADQQNDQKARVIAITGVRGGVGSSTLSHNIGYELAREFGEDVIVADLDIAYGTAAMNFNVAPRYTIADALAQNTRLDDVLMERFVEPINKKLSVLTAPASLNAGVHVTSDNLEMVMGYLRRMASFVVLDVPHVWQGWTRDLLTEVDEVVLVTKPDLCNLRDAKNMVEVLNPERGVHLPTRLVFNMVGEAKKTELGPRDFKEHVSMDVAVSVPFDPTVFGKAMNNGEMISKFAARCKATEAVKKLARMVSARVAIEESKGKVFSFLTRKKAS